MEDRIKIGDVWYVKEDQTLKTEEFKTEEFSIIRSRGLQIDLEDYCLIASVLESDDGEFSMPSIDKKTIDGDKLLECMDNELWIKGVADRKEDSLNHLNDVYGYTKEAIIKLCDEIKKLKWI